VVKPTNAADVPVKDSLSICAPFLTSVGLAHLVNLFGTWNIHSHCIDTCILSRGLVEASGDHTDSPQ
jgi:hypothetical protein